jgi:signal transduction histidine kinase
MNVAIQAGRLREVLVSGIGSWWPTLSLARQFTLASSALVLVGLGVLGLWVSQKIATGIKANAAERTALYMESVIAPHLQNLSGQRGLSQDAKLAIDAIMAKDAERMRVVDVKIWTRDGVVLYATDNGLVGKKFSLTPALSSAWRGNVETHFEDSHPKGDHGVNLPEAAPLLEIYVPMRHIDSGKIIAVAEFYEVTTELNRELRRTQIETWLVTGLVSLSIILGLYSIVANGSRTIDTQRTSLANRIGELSDLLEQNEDLRRHVQEASRRSTEAAELQLRRLGADLHDGPAQLLALALLKLDQVLDGPSADRSKDGQAVRGVLRDAMSEIRDISGGLALPEIEKLSLAQALMVVAAEHERRTCTTVSCEFPNRSIDLSHSVKLCLCRVVQEALSNAYKHAGGVGQRVVATWSEWVVVIEVSDYGPGLPTLPTKGKRASLGIIGLRHRLESLGGSLHLTSEPGKGTQLTAWLPINAKDTADA